MKLLLTAIVVSAGVLALATSSASAQDSDSGESATSQDAVGRDHFEVGRRQYRLGQFREAATAFRRAYELSGRPALLMNIYLSYRDAAEPGLAAQALREYIERGDHTDAERQELEVRAAALERQAEAQSAGADGSSTVDPTNDAPTPSSGGADLTAPVILLSAGGAVLLAGIGTGIATAIENGSLEDACPREQCTPAESGRIDTVESLALASDVLLGVGIAATAAGAVWLILEMSGDEPSTESTQLAPACNGAGCMGVLKGTW